MNTSFTEITEFFQENGYYLAKGVYSPAEMAELEMDFDRIVRQLQGSGEKVADRWDGAVMEKIAPKDSIFIHTHNVQIFSAVWHRAFLQKRFIETTQAILNSSDIILHHSKLFQKPAEKGAPFPMHQDYSYFPTVKDNMIAGVIMVSEATDDMGCLRVYPGSHKLGRLKESNGQTDLGVLRDYPLENSTPLETEPGDVLFFHYLTLHGSKPNRSQKIRKSVLAQMHSGDDQIEEGNDHPNSRLVLSGWNYHAKRSLGNQV